MKSKVKISGVKNFKDSGGLNLFDITLKNEKEVLSGTVLILRKSKTISVNLGKPLENKCEKLPVLKEIFYCFCLTECKRRKNRISEHLEEYIFIDENMKIKNPKSVIDNLMQYDEEDFDRYNRKSKIISYIKFSYDKIIEANKMKVTFLELDPIFDFSKKEMEVYKKILIKYLKSKGVRGLLEYKKVMYNDSEIFGYNLYYFNYSFYMVTYEILDFMR